MYKEHSTVEQRYFLDTRAPILATRDKFITELSGLRSQLTQEGIDLDKRPKGLTFEQAKSNLDFLNTEIGTRLPIVHYFKSSPTSVSFLDEQTDGTEYGLAFKYGNNKPGTYERGLNLKLVSDGEILEKVNHTTLMNLYYSGQRRIINWLADQTPGSLLQQIEDKYLPKPKAQ